MINGQFNEWARYALITRLAKELGGSGQFGKKAAQKVVYLLQQIGKVPTGFRYTFYTYGVFSSELANTLGVVEGLGGIVIDYDQDSNAYSIGPGDKADKIRQRGHSFLDSHEDAIDKIVTFAKGKTARTLELVSTIIFVAMNEKLHTQNMEAELIERVRALKPQFSDTEIKSEIVGLLRMNYLP